VEEYTKIMFFIKLRSVCLLHIATDMKMCSYKKLQFDIFSFKIISFGLRTTWLCENRGLEYAKQCDIVSFIIMW